MLMSSFGSLSNEYFNFSSIAAMWCVCALFGLLLFQNLLFSLQNFLPSIVGFFVFESLHHFSSLLNSSRVLFGTLVALLNMLTLLCLNWSILWRRFVVVRTNTRCWAKLQFTYRVRTWIPFLHIFDFILNSKWSRSFSRILKFLHKNILDIMDSGWQFRFEICLLCQCRILAMRYVCKFCSVSVCMKIVPRLLARQRLFGTVCCDKILKEKKSLPTSTMCVR